MVDKNSSRVVITGVGLTCPGANSLNEFRSHLLEGNSHLSSREIEGIGNVPLGECNFDETQFLHKKMRKRGTRAGSLGVYCANKALENANLDLDGDSSFYNKRNCGVYVGITEHGAMEAEVELKKLSDNPENISLWSPFHNPRTIANAPAGEITLNLGLHGPHYTIGAACAAGNIALIHGLQMIKLEEVDFSLCGGISEAVSGLHFFASFYAQGALSLDENPKNACSPLDEERKGIVISEGGAIFCLESLDKALDRKAPILGEVVGYGINSDATDFVNPNNEEQAECIKLALKRAGLKAFDIDLVNLHATGTKIGDKSECDAIKAIFKDCHNTHFNCSKGLIGHAMGAAGALELAGNLPSFGDNMVHGSKNTRSIDPEIGLENVVKDGEIVRKEVKTIMNISFGMLGINSCVIVKKYGEE